MNVFTDEYCLICHAVLQPEISWSSVLLRVDEEVICSSCNNKLKPLDGETCRLCNRVLATEYKTGDLCYDCLRWEEDPEWGGLLVQNLSLFEYNDFLKEMIARFKYRGDYLLAAAFKNKMRKMLRDHSFDMLVPIPLSSERLYERGFNQAEALIVKAGYEPTTLLSRVHTEKQSKKSRADRIHLPQVFRMNSEEVPRIQGRQILLVDDIYTTGSTLRHAAKVLHDNGVGQVCSLTIAR
jgi:competence protein ComFC